MRFCPLRIENGSVRSAPRHAASSLVWHACVQPPLLCAYTSAQLAESEAASGPIWCVYSGAAWKQEPFALAFIPPIRPGANRDLYFRSVAHNETEHRAAPTTPCTAEVVKLGAM